MRTNWIAWRVHSRLAPLPVLSTCGSGRHRPSSSVARGFSCGCRLALSCLLHVSRAGFSSFPLGSLLAIRSAPIVVSLGSPFVRQVGRGDGGCLCPCLYDFTQCYMPLIPVIYLAFLLYIGHSCYISRILVICLAFLLYISYSCYINLFHVILFCISNAIMGGCV